MPYIHRPYAGNEDYPAMRELMVQMYAVNGPPVYCTIGDLDWWRWGPGAAINQITLAELWWTEGGILAGMVWIDPSRTNELVFDLLIHPAYPDVEEAMLTWVEARRPPLQEAGPGYRTVWSFRQHERRSRLLEQHGYKTFGVALSFLGRELAGALPTLPLPTGYTIRHVQGEADFPQRVEVHRNAFTRSRLTVDTYRTLAAEAPTYRPALDLVVTAPDSSFAAYCLVWFDAANKIGVFEPVGCHSAHRQKGLTKAVMVEGLRRLQALGATRAFVNTVRGEPAANALYRSVGFDEIDQNEAWKKEV